jgi:PAS domain-containing protein
MPPSDQRRPSLYLNLAWIIVTTVAAITALHSVYLYWDTRNSVLAAMQRSATLSITSLQKNIANFIQSYAPNQYENLVLTEIEQRAHFAIIVEDFNMGKILGQTAYTSGKIHDGGNRIIDYDPGNSEHQAQLQTCFHSERQVILDDAGQPLGTITVYQTDQQLTDQLRQTLVRQLVVSLTIALLLIITLFLSIRASLLRPISEMAKIISSGDQDGIPLRFIEQQKYRELATLTTSMNAMIAAVKGSRLTLDSQNRKLQEEKNRFQLAIEGSQDGLWDWNPQTNRVFYSKRWKSMIGYRDDEIGD